MTGDLIKIQLRDRTEYSCTGVVDFLQPIFDEYMNDYPTVCILRGDSGFEMPDLYKQCEENGTSYVIQLKGNDILSKKTSYFVEELEYNIFNWFRRLVLSANMRKQRIDTVRLKLLKIVAKVVHSARYITFKLCSSCLYKNEFYEILSNIGKLNVQLE